MDDRIISQIAPYFERIRAQRGLRSWMNRALQARPELPDLLWMVIRYLVRSEALFGYGGSIRLTRNALYFTLAEVEPEWVLTCPHPLPGLAFARLPSADAGPAVAPRVIENRLALDQATAIGKKVRLLQEGPKGKWGLHADLLTRLRRVTAK